MAGPQIASTAFPTTWWRLNRPIGRLRLEAVLDGMRRFAAAYRGRLLTETMLVAGCNDDEPGLRATAAFVASLAPERAYVALPTRPPAETWVPSSPEAAHAVAFFVAAGLATSGVVEEIDEGEEPFAVSRDAARGLLGIVAVHPMTESAARAYLARAGADWSVAEALVDGGRIDRIRHHGRTYLRARLRPISHGPSRPQAATARQATPNEMRRHSQGREGAGDTSNPMEMVS